MENNNNNNKNTKNKNDHLSYDYTKKNDFQYDYTRTKEQSKNSNHHRARRSRRKIFKSKKAKAVGCMFALGIGAVVGVKGYQMYQDTATVNDYFDRIEQVVYDNTARTDDGMNQQINPWRVSNEYQDMLDQGEDARVIAYIAGNQLDADYERDELDHIFNNLFGSDADTWLKNQGYSSFSDSKLAKEAKDIALEEARENKNTNQLSSMLEEDVTNDYSKGGNQL